MSQFMTATNTYFQIDDSTLIDQCVAGDERATRELLTRVIPRVRKTVQYLCGCAADREDIVQTALIEIVKSAKSFRAESSLLYWVDRVTVFTASKQFEKSNRREEIRNRTWVSALEVKSVEEQIDSERMKNRMSEIFGELNSSHRVPLVLHYLHGYKVDEIADISGLKRNTVRGRLRSGMKRVRKKVLEDPLLYEWVLGR